MLRKVESTSDVNRGPEPCQSGTVLTFPVLCLAYTRVVSQILAQIDDAVRAYAHAYNNHYLTRSKFNSVLTEMITPQTYIYIHIKPLPVPRVFGARSGSPRTTVLQEHVHPQHYDAKQRPLWWKTCHREVSLAQGLIVNHTPCIIVA